MTKILATFVGGKLTKMKDLPTNQEILEQEGLVTYRANKLLHEIDLMERQILAYTRDNFDDLRDFVRHNI